MKTIKLRLRASEDWRTVSLNINDLVNSQEDWDELTEDEQSRKIREYVDEIEQPYWDFDILN